MINLIGRLLLQAVMKLFFKKTIKYIVVGNDETNDYEYDQSSKLEYRKETDYHQYGHPN